MKPLGGQRVGVIEWKVMFTMMCYEVMPYDT